MTVQCTENLFHNIHLCSVCSHIIKNWNEEVEENKILNNNSRPTNSASNNNNNNISYSTKVHKAMNECSLSTSANANRILLLCQIPFLFCCAQKRFGPFFEHIVDFSMPSFNILLFIYNDKSNGNRQSAKEQDAARQRQKMYFTSKWKYSIVLSLLLIHSCFCCIH